jgi:putative endonuclease
MSKRQDGHRWERAAESFLHRRGLSTVERNFHCRLGEVDIIMNDGPFLVFVEVKYRRHTHHGDGAESVNAAKRRRIENTAAFFLARNPRQARRPCRFDVVAIDGATGNEHFDWIKDAFQATQG